MSESTTTARPYAKAIFEYALAQNQLAKWSGHLNSLAQAVSMQEASQFINNPVTTVTQHVELLQSVIASDADKGLDNLLSLLATNKRLMLLPEIAALYEVHRAEQEKTLVVEVITHSELSAEQQQQLIDALSKRLKRQVSLDITTDTSLIGGAVVRAGDLVIDGSVKGKLNKLAANLAA